MRSDIFSGLFEYGRKLQVFSGEDPEGRMGRGFIEPVNPADTESLRKNAMPGTAYRGKYLLIAPAGLINPEETKLSVHCDGVEYEVLRVEPVGGGSHTHWEGIMRMKGKVEGCLKR